MMSVCNYYSGGEIIKPNTIEKLVREIVGDPGWNNSDQTDLIDIKYFSKFQKFPTRITLKEDKWKITVKAIEGKDHKPFYFPSPITTEDYTLEDGLKKALERVNEWRKEFPK